MIFKGTMCLLKVKYEYENKLRSVSHYVVHNLVRELPSFYYLAPGTIWLIWQPKSPELYGIDAL